MKEKANGIYQNNKLIIGGQNTQDVSHLVVIFNYLIGKNVIDEEYYQKYLIGLTYYQLSYEM